MSNLNELNIGGELTQNPVSRTTPAGKEVVNLNLKCVTKNGKFDSTCFINIPLWHNEHRAVAKTLLAGDFVEVWGGQLKYRMYEKKDGTKGFSLECMNAKEIVPCPTDQPEFADAHRFPETSLTEDDIPY